MRWRLHLENTSSARFFRLHEKSPVLYSAKMEAFPLRHSARLKAEPAPLHPILLWLIHIHIPREIGLFLTWELCFCFRQLPKALISSCHWKHKISKCRITSTLLTFLHSWHFLCIHQFKEWILLQLQWIWFTELGCKNCFCFCFLQFTPKGGYWQHCLEDQKVGNSSVGDSPVSSSGENPSFLWGIHPSLILRPGRLEGVPLQAVAQGGLLWLSKWTSISHPSDHSDWSK